mmetsp:Transcript_10735/g.31055  ORF Transcript_10735/g.31055 Transcript_10735/m.31055 type:complete len:200 (-) Transcript_10735:361-960(-)
MKDHTPYTSLSDFNFSGSRMDCSHPAALDARSQSNRCVLTISEGETTLCTVGRTFALGLRVRMVFSMPANRASPPAVLRRSVLLRRITSANSICSMSSWLSGRSSSPLHASSPPSLTNSDVCITSSKLLASTTVTQVSSRDTSRSFLSFSSPLFSSSVISPLVWSCPLACPWTCSSLRSIAQVSATCMGSLMPVDSTSR